MKKMRTEARGKIEEIIFPNKLLISTEEREVPEKLFISFIKLDLDKLGILPQTIGHFPSPENLDKARNILRKSSQFFEVGALERRRIFSDSGKLTMFWTKFPHFLCTEDIQIMIEDLESLYMKKNKLSLSETKDMEGIAEEICKRLDMGKKVSIGAFKQRMEEKQKLGCILEKVDVGDEVVLKGKVD
jgi:hypothetical protein